MEVRTWRKLSNDEKVMLRQLFDWRITFLQDRYDNKEAAAKYARLLDKIIKKFESEL